MAVQTETVPSVLQAIGDPARRKILQVLKEKGCCSIEKSTGMCACDIEARLKLSQPTISHHMRVLTKAGLVQATKVGPWMWYRRNEKAIQEFLGALRDDL
jgi:ArsR family transcriptional regulator, arsenate/arsenite/antimonite-responsive transcriptional repressor